MLVSLRPGGGGAVAIGSLQKIDRHVDRWLPALPSVGDKFHWRALVRGLVPCGYGGSLDPALGLDFLPKGRYVRCDQSAVGESWKRVLRPVLRPG